MREGDAILDEEGRKTTMKINRLKPGEIRQLLRRKGESKRTVEEVGKEFGGLEKEDVEQMWEHVQEIKLEELVKSER